MFSSNTSQAQASQTYVDDVFSTYLYTGNGSTQTINNGIDLAGKGGLVWIKLRSGPDAVSNHVLFDTVRGAGRRLYTNTTDAEFNGGNILTAFTSSGFTIDASIYNDSSNAPVSWTFRKAPKFFDVVTYTGNGVARTIAHSLGSAPGCIIVKRTDTTGNWQVYHNGLTSAAYSIQLNLTSAQASATTVWNSTAPTSSVFSVGTDATVNASGGTYVAYLFAHDTSSTGMIQCGLTSGGASTEITLGWEPQYLLYRSATFTDDWHVIDNMRGAAVGAPTYNTWSNLNINTSASETSVTGSGGNPNIKFTATGFVLGAIAGNAIYIAIRRPNKPPTSGTQVFSPNTYAGGTANRSINLGFVPDALLTIGRNSVSNRPMQSRLTGTMFLLTDQTVAESDAGAGMPAWDAPSNTYSLSNNTYAGWNASGTNYVSEAFKRAPGFFDEVCYTGTGSSPLNISHNLTVVPEMMIIKNRSFAASWAVYVAPLGNTHSLLLDDIGGQLGSFWNNTSPTISQFTVGTGTAVNGAYTFVAYLFATVAGISKVGSYTGTGSTQTISCGFTGGARFVLIKRTDSTGDWYVWDTARGMVSGTDPSLLLNSTAAEVNANSIYTTTGGFQIVSTAAGINASGGSYIYLAIA